MYPACTLHAPCMYPARVLHASCMYPACTLLAPCMYPACTLHAPCMYPARVLHGAQVLFVDSMSGSPHGFVATVIFRSKEARSQAPHHAASAHHAAAANSAYVSWLGVFVRLRPQSCNPNKTREQDRTRPVTRQSKRGRTTERYSSTVYTSSCTGKKPLAETW